MFAAFSVLIVAGIAVTLAAFIRAVVRRVNMPSRGERPAPGRVCARAGCSEMNPGEAGFCRRCGAALFERRAA